MQPFVSPSAAHINVTIFDDDGSGAEFDNEQFLFLPFLGLQLGLHRGSDSEGRYNTGFCLTAGIVLFTLHQEEGLNDIEGLVCARW